LHEFSDYSVGSRPVSFHYEHLAALAGQRRGHGGSYNPGTNHNNVKHDATVANFKYIWGHGVCRSRGRGSGVMGGNEEERGERKEREEKGKGYGLFCSGFLAFWLFGLFSFFFSLSFLAVIWYGSFI
jgi:hypothetical protein